MRSASTSPFENYLNGVDKGCSSCIFEIYSFARGILPRGGAHLHYLFSRLALRRSGARMRLHSPKESSGRHRTISFCEGRERSTGAVAVSALKIFGSQTHESGPLRVLMAG